MTAVSHGRELSHASNDAAAAAKQTRILVADDDQMCRRLMQRFLQQANYDVVMCENGTSASDILLGDNPPLIAILDWMMPDISGPDVCAVIREEDLAIQPYLIVLTSKNDKAELAHALDAGADDFLTKPFNAVELGARLKVAERSVQRQLKLQAEIQRLRNGDENDPNYSRLLALAVERATETLGLGRMEKLPCAGLRGQVMWTPIIFPEEDVWLDLLTDAEPRSTEQNPEITWRLHQAIVEAVRLERPTMLTPHPAKLALPDFDAPAHEFRNDDALIRIACLRSSNPAHKLAVNELRTSDVLAEAYPPKQEVPLLRRGAVLNNRIIDRLFEFAHEMADDVPKVHIFRPSTYALGSTK